MPLLVVSNAAQETDIAEALLAGAQDLVSLGQTERLRSVAERELRAFRLERALNETLFSANQYKKQLKAFLAGSVDAIAHTQEGILVDANQAWADLLGHESGDALLGVPLMDLFDNASKAALKGALVACGRGQWTGGSLKVTATTGGGDKLPIELNLEATSVDGEPAVKLSVPRPPAAAREPEELIEQAVHKDPMTGFYHRRRFLEVLTDRLDAGGGRGVRVLAYIRPDKFRELEEQIGPLASEDVLVQIAEQLRELTQPHDLYGRFGGQIFTMFLERGTLRDVEAWAQNALARIAARIFESAHNTLSVTCTIGLAEIGPSTERLDALLAEARRSNQLGPRSRRQSGRAATDVGREHARPALRRDLGAADQGRAHGEPLPARAPADRELERRAPGHVRHGAAHDRRARRRGDGRRVHARCEPQSADACDRPLGHRRELGVLHQDTARLRVHQALVRVADRPNAARLARARPSRAPAWRRGRSASKSARRTRRST